MPKQPDVPVAATRTSLRIVEALRAGGEAGPSALASRLDMATSTVHDHLRTLEQCQYVVRDDDTYRIGTRFLDVGGCARQRMPIFAVAKPEVRRLARETGQHANLMVEDFGVGVFLYKATAEGAVHLDTYEGMRVPLHSTALGKAILAHLAEARVESILDEHGLPAVTENTVTDRETLHDELDGVRERGYAVDDEERVEGMRCIAAPILAEGETRGAISVSGPTSEMRGDRFNAEIPDRVLSTANIVEVNITYS